MDSDSITSKVLAVWVLKIAVLLALGLVLAQELVIDLINWLTNSFSSGTDVTRISIIALVLFFVQLIASELVDERNHNLISQLGIFLFAVFILGPAIVPSLLSPAISAVLGILSYLLVEGYFFFTSEGDD